MRRLEAITATIKPYGEGVAPYTKEQKAEIYDFVIKSNLREYLIKYDIVAKSAKALEAAKLTETANLNNWPVCFKWLGTARQFTYFVYKLSIEAANHGKSIYKGRGAFDVQRFYTLFPDLQNLQNPTIDKKYLSELNNDNEKPPKGYLLIEKVIKGIF